MRIWKEWRVKGNKEERTLRNEEIAKRGLFCLAASIVVVTMLVTTADIGLGISALVVSSLTIASLWGISFVAVATSNLGLCVIAMLSVSITLVVVLVLAVAIALLSSVSLVLGGIVGVIVLIIRRQRCSTAVRRLGGSRF